jgi:hypothetical protein
VKRAVASLAALSAFSAASVLASCQNAEEAPSTLKSAELGVFYGGEIQERRKVSMPKDRQRPTLGFRLTMTEPLRAELPVHWEIDLPGPADRRVQSVGDARVPAGQARFDQVLAVPEGAALGLWNVRVTTGERIVIDRALVLEP